MRGLPRSLRLARLHVPAPTTSPGWRSFSAQVAEEWAAASGPAGAAAAAARGTTVADRYAALVAAGTLQHDPQQAACVQRLDRLRSDLAVYREQVAAYQQDYAGYQQRRQELHSRLAEEEEARLAVEEAAAARRDAGGLASLARWLASAAGGQPEGAAQRRTPRQRRALAWARAERRAAERAGPPPLPPPAPRGVYLHGSVGSGKSLLMDLLSVAVHGQEAGGRAPGGDAPAPAPAPALLHRRLHFNHAMQELHSRMHAIESSRTEQEQRQLEAYAAAVREQQQREQQRRQDASQAAASSEQSAVEGGEGAAWQQILRLDPIAQRMRRSKLARLAFRRMMRDKLSRSPEQHSAALAATNATVLLHAARALIRNCNTLQLMRASGAAEGGADAGARIAALLCFDEVQVSDPFTASGPPAVVPRCLAQAVALKGLMEALLAEGCVVVATSNRAPTELDRHGLHEDIFSHFIHSLQSACDVVCLDSQHDYRRLLAAQAPLQPLDAPAPLGNIAAASEEVPEGAAVAGMMEQLHPQASYFYPLGPAAAAALRHRWRQLAGAAPAAAARLPVGFGRRLEAARCAGGVAWFRFEELCARPLGAADYMAVAEAFHTVFIEGVPPLSMQVRDQARRFITLVDELYCHRTRLVCSAAAPPDQLFAGAGQEEAIVDLESLQFETAVEGSRLRRNLMADGGVAPVAATASAAADAARRLGGEEERFAFARAVSRLYEMQSEPYLASRPRQQ